MSFSMSDLLSLIGEEHSPRSNPRASRRPRSYVSTSLAPINRNTSAKAPTCSVCQASFPNQRLFQDHLDSSGHRLFKQSVISTPQRNVSRNASRQPDYSTRECRWGHKCHHKDTTCKFNHPPAPPRQQPPRSASTALTVVRSTQPTYQKKLPRASTISSGDMHKPKASNPSAVIKYVSSVKIPVPRQSQPHYRDYVSYKQYKYRFSPDFQNVTVTTGEQKQTFRAPAPSLFPTRHGLCFYDPAPMNPIQEATQALQITHSLDCAALSQPVALQIPGVKNATYYKHCGESLLYFVPYSDPFADTHFERVVLYRYSHDHHRYEYGQSFTLKGHYCNDADAHGQFLVLSWWPYDKGALRALWNAAKQMDLKNAELAQSSHLNAKLVAQLARMEAKVQNLQRELRQAQEREREAKRLEMEAAKRQKALQQQYERLRYQHERDRQERLRWADPIHLHVFNKATQKYVLVMDYHKGAHGLRLYSIKSGQVGRLFVCEDDYEYEFELAAPSDAELSRWRKFIPKKLCDDF